MSPMHKRKILAVLLLLSLCFHVPSHADTHIYAANRNAGKYIALTFDDGPHPVYTAQILDILKAHHAKATFFVIGQNAEQYPELLRREAQEGHELGNHTYSHPNMKTLSVEKATEELEKNQKVIESITGIRPRLFRAPGGIFSDSLVSAVEAHACKPVLWSWRQDTRDWSRPPVEQVVRTVLDNLRDGDIVLFHDYNTNGSPTPEALRILLPELIRRGYSFVTVSELMELGSEILTAECDK